MHILHSRATLRMFCSGLHPGPWRGLAAEGTAEKAVNEGKLRLAGDERWALPITVYAYRDLAHSRSAVVKLMATLQRRAQRMALQPERGGLHLTGMALDEFMRGGGP